ncbi:hypothetical protein JJJ17_05455 [Paracoccus caeni]|uniref:CatB-related O-acetyltransferase n=1 Tax=Paracoccus caeni TaxID=657651 RepID=A0A934SJ32_9RHOB|nr:DapH/DapD/GlmU-related protein [Paracoccus caeni]MBK4215368.1 hypothetical protein [Paracoccus caeni]
MLSTSTFLNSHSWDCEELEQFRARNKDILTSTLDAIRAPTSRNRMQVVIGNDVWIGQGAIIRKGVTIGDGAVIGANSVISRDVAPYEIVMGVPAQSLRYRFDMKTVERLTEAKWWEFSLESLDGVPWHDPDAASIQLLQRRQQNDFAPAVYPRITYPADTDG